MAYRNTCSAVGSHITEIGRKNVLNIDDRIREDRYKYHYKKPISHQEAIL